MKKNKYLLLAAIINLILILISTTLIVIYSFKSKNAVITLIYILIAVFTFGSTILIYYLLIKDGVKFIEFKKKKENKTEVNIQTPKITNEIKLFKNKRILVVEDNNINIEIMNEILGAMGVIVDVAENGLVAFNKVCNNISFYYDMIIMDLQMPIMNGYESTAKIRALNRKDVKTIPIIAMTANTFASDIASIKACGADNYLAKPIDIDELYYVMEKYLKAKSID